MWTITNGNTTYLRNFQQHAYILAFVNWQKIYKVEESDYTEK